MTPERSQQIDELLEEALGVGAFRTENMLLDNFR
jgi:hypothetical protein